VIDHELRVDMIKCDAYGYRAELLPELIELDDWGYPIVTGDVTPELLDAARRAGDACSRLAIRLARVARPPGRPLPLASR
jgi:ferredoxin